MNEAESSEAESTHGRSTGAESAGVDSTSAESTSRRATGARDRETWTEEWISPDGPLYGKVLVWAWQACAWSARDPLHLTDQVLTRFHTLASHSPRFDGGPRKDGHGNWRPECNSAIRECGRIFHQLADGPAVDSDREAWATRYLLALAAVALRSGIQAQVNVRRVAAADTEAFKESFAQYLDWLAYRILGARDVVRRDWTLVPLHAVKVGGRSVDGNPPPILDIAGLPADNRHRNDVWWKAFTETCGQVLEGRAGRVQAEAQVVAADLVRDERRALPLLREVLQSLGSVARYSGRNPTRADRDRVWLGRLWLWLDLLREIAQLATPRTLDDERRRARIVGPNVSALEWFEALDTMRKQGQPIDSIARTGIAPPIPLLWEPYWPKTKACPILRHAAAGLFGPEYILTCRRP